MFQCSIRVLRNDNVLVHFVSVGTEILWMKIVNNLFIFSHLSIFFETINISCIWIYECFIIEWNILRLGGTLITHAFFVETEKSWAFAKLHIRLTKNAHIIGGDAIFSWKANDKKKSFIDYASFLRSFSF